MRKILQNTRGETITEVLVASLVVVLGVLLFATMVSSSYTIITNSEKRMLDIYDAESNAVNPDYPGRKSHGAHTVTFSLAKEGLLLKEDLPSSVDVFGDDVFKVLVYTMTE